MRPRHRLPLAAALLTAASLAACGSASATHGSPGRASPSSATTSDTAARSSSTASSTPSSACAATVAQTLAQVGERIYRAAASSEDVTQAVHRVQSSAALARAVASGDAAAARAALRSLQLGQIVRVQVLRGGRVLASAGSGGALAPVRGSIPGTNATFVLSVQSDANYVEVARQVSGAQVQISSAAAHGGAGRWLAGAPHQALPARGPVTLAGARYEVASFAGSAFPSGGARIALLVPASASSCAGSSAQARVETLGHVGERIYEEELHGASVARTLRIMQASSAFQHAVAARSASATRAAIVGFFRAHLHVVRVRVSVDGRLLVDVGGPYVLAPVHGTLRSGGRVVGRFTWAIQDDAGYEKLARLFTGAQVLMREGSRQVMGTLSPGPASVPARGTVGYGGRSYEAYSFDAEAFPAGPLRISLLLAS